MEPKEFAHYVFMESKVMAMEAAMKKHFPEVWIDYKKNFANQLEEPYDNGLFDGDKKLKDGVHDILTHHFPNRR